MKPLGWTKVAQITRSLALFNKFQTKGPPIQNPSTINFSMLRWSIRVSWSSVKPSQVFSISSGPIDLPLAALRRSSAITRYLFENSSIGLKAWFSKPATVAFNPPPGSTKRGSPVPASS